MGMSNPFKSIIGYLRGDYQQEFCPRCQANLKLQKGYDNSLPYWNCLGCGEMLINPEIDTEDNIVWVCDQCADMLNIQPGFDVGCGEWTCRKCGFVNVIDESELYASEDEFQAAIHSPYRGLSDEDVLALSMYQDDEALPGRDDVLLVYRPDTGKKYVKKLLKVYDKSIYDWLRKHPIPNMPRIVDVFESDNCLIVIEEFIQGVTLEEILEREVIPEDRAIRIAGSLCTILDVLHSSAPPIIHRDVKPSNIMITPEDQVILLDVNAARWDNPDQTDDTRYMGTQFYAAPEQYGFGTSASSGKVDVYAVGVLLNVMVTGKLPKHELVKGRLRPVVERCISLEADDRYTSRELKMTLNHLK